MEGQFLSDVKVQIDDTMSLGNSVNEALIRIIFKRWGTKKLCTVGVWRENNELQFYIKGNRE